MLLSLLWAADCNSSNNISASKFWELYYQDNIQLLQRDKIRISGTGVQREQKRHPNSVLQQTETFTFSLSRASLSEYNYGSDPRFTAFEILPAKINETIDRIIQGDYPFRDSAPFGQTRMSELFTQIKEHLAVSEEEKDVLAVLDQLILDFLRKESAEYNQVIAALVWFLGEIKERSSSESVIQVLRHSRHLNNNQFQINSSVEETAFFALWKINDKSKLTDILELMRHSDETGRRKIANLLTRLLSTDELLSLYKIGPTAWATPDYWDKIITPRQHWSLAKWDQFDASSLFWEIRYLAAKRIPKIDPLNELLSNDEVEPVRTAALNNQIHSGHKHCF